MKREKRNAETPLNVIVLTWAIAVFSGLVFGALLNGFVYGYGAGARLGAIAGGVPMLVLGALVAQLMPWSEIDFVLRDFYWVAIVFIGGVFALLGGSFGAVIGGAADRFYRYVDAEPPVPAGDF